VKKEVEVEGEVSLLLLLSLLLGLVSSGYGRLKWRWRLVWWIGLLRSRWMRCERRVFWTAGGTSEGRMSRPVTN